MPEGEISRKRFFAHENYRNASGKYELLPFRHARIPNIREKVLVTSCVGEYTFLSSTDFDRLIGGTLTREDDVFHDLRNRQIICDPETGPYLEGLASQSYTRKHLASEDPALHIFVVTLRCDHRCVYCQVSPRKESEVGFDMSDETACAALDRVFESTAPCLTIEFQGGESALAFDRIRTIVLEAKGRPTREGQTLRFVIATNVHLLTDRMLEFCAEHEIEISTSLDGPAHVHDANRILGSKDSFQRTLDGIARARAICGHDRVAALATITRHSLPFAREIVDTYVGLGFGSVSLRPITPLGFAKRSHGKIGYPTLDYLTFYRQALEYLIELNLAGTTIQETYASLLLTRILTPFPTTYVDLQSPAAAGSAVMAYNYDGKVYVSDEGRMLAEMGDPRFCMGTVDDSLETLQGSEAMQIIRDAGTAEELPVCRDCAFVTYCGADPVLNVATQGDPVGVKESSEFCHRHTGLFQLLFEKLEERDPDVMRVFLAWIRNVDAAQISSPGYMA